MTWQELGSNSRVLIPSQRQGGRSLVSQRDGVVVKRANVFAQVSVTYAVGRVVKYTQAIAYRVLGEIAPWGKQSFFVISPK